MGDAGDNGECSVGVAPQTIISSCNIYSDRPESFSDESFLAVKIDAFDISQNSWGYNALHNLKGENYKPRVRLPLPTRGINSIPAMFATSPRYPRIVNMRSSIIVFIIMRTM
jgi:hypothetical protein